MAGIVRKSLLFCGIALLVLNLVGLFVSMRNNEIYSEKKTCFKNDIILTESQFYSEIQRGKKVREYYVKTVNRAVNRGLAHYWRDEGVDKYNLRVPFFENYLLFLGSYLHPEKFLKFQFMNYKRAVERGVGLCSQHALVAVGILNEKGIPARMIDLSGHVVCTAQVYPEKNEWWVLDPDYGVVIPHGIREIENDPSLIFPYYEMEGYGSQRIGKVIKVYEKDGNELISQNGVKHYSINHYYREHVSYILIWIIPILFMLPSGIRFLKGRRLKIKKKK